MERELTQPMQTIHFIFISFLSFTVHKTKKSKQDVTSVYDRTIGPNTRSVKGLKVIKKMVMRIERGEGLKHIYSKDR